MVRQQKLFQNMCKVNSKGSQTLKWHTQNQSRKGRKNEETSRKWPRHDNEELDYIMNLGKQPHEWHQSVVQA